MDISKAHKFYSYCFLGFGFIFLLTERDEYHHGLVSEQIYQHAF